MAKFNIKVQKGASASSDVQSIRIGAHYDCLCQVDDPLVADFHARVTNEQGGFYVEDLGSSPGTFKNGLVVESKTPIVDGDVLVLGRTHVKVAVKDGDITLTASPKSFFYEDFQKEKRDKKDPTVILSPAQEGDAVRWSRSEVLFGRYAPMRAGNWFGLAGVVAVIVFGIVLAGPREQLSEPGDLHNSHAMFFDEAGLARLRANPNIQAAWIEAAETEGCDVCHDAFGGTPMSKCATCHSDLMKGQHPFSDVPLSLSEVSAGVQSAGHLERGWGSEDCLICHVDHQGGEKGAVSAFVPSPEETPETCSACHDVEALPDAESMSRDTEPIPPFATLATMAYVGFPHDSHMAIDCADCHVRDDSLERPIFDLGDMADPRNHREFASISYEVCMECHSPVAGERSERFQANWATADNQYELSWHGADEAGNCTQCHQDVYDVPLRLIESVVLSDFLSFSFERRDHQTDIDAHLGDVGEDRDCSECHVDKVIASTDGNLATGVFRHGVHMALLQPVPGTANDASALSEQCAACHTEMVAGGAYDDQLATELYPGPDTSGDQCAECHTAGAVRDLSGRLAMSVQPPDQLPPPTWRSDFPHGPHLTASALATAELEDGCFACHAFPGADDAAYAVQPVTFDSAKTCVQCHDDHRYVGNAGSDPAVCAECHTGTSLEPPAEVAAWADWPDWSGDPAYWVGVERVLANDVPSGKPWPPPNEFEHSSPGHAPFECTVCHDRENLEGAQDLMQVLIPDESDFSCRKCHVEQRKRFHWR